MPDSLALVLLGALGALTCLAGYRLFLASLAFLGAMVGAILGLAAGGLLDSSVAPVVGTVLGGVVFGWLAVSAYRAAVALLGAVVFGATAAVLCAVAGPIAQLLGWLVGAALGAGLALVLQRTVIVFGTAVHGALAAVLAGTVLAGPGTLAAYQSRFAEIISGAKSPTRVLGHPGYVVLWAGLVVVGVVVQVRRVRGEPRPT